LTLFCGSSLLYFFFTGGVAMSAASPSRQR
jgi:hypothetical protein